MTLALLLVASLAAAAPDSGHRCDGGEPARYAFDAAHDTLDRSEQEHVCRCRKELHVANQAYYDASRDLCEDNWTQFQCLEKGGDWRCASPGRCLCDAKPRRCVEKDLTAWKDFACGAGNCEETRLLQGRDPKAKIDCKGGGRWRCVSSPKCPTTGEKVCAETDFGAWRAVGCAAQGCAKGQMRLVRDKKTYLLCDEARYQRCKPDPACAAKAK